MSITTFAPLGVDPPLLAALAGEGITEPFPIQTLAIPDVLAGRDVCGRARTGSGKTLAFGVPLLQRLAAEPGERAPGSGPRPVRPVRGLVLAPTRELARQIVGALAPLARAAGLRVEACYGGVAVEPQVRALRRGVDVAVATPGRLIDLVQRGAVDLDSVATAVVDEADRMADLGFLPQVEWIMRQLRPGIQVLLFSATLDGQVDRLVRSYLTDPVHHDVVGGQPTVEQVVHRFVAVHQMDRVLVAAAICRTAARAIVFVRTKRGADRLVQQLRREGAGVAAIHGDLRQSAREKALAGFTAGRVPVLVATDVAARGIHVDDIDVVLHFDLPEDHKAYVHRSGRTARAGKTGLVVTFVLWNQGIDVERLQRSLGLDEPVVEMLSNDPRLADLAGTEGARAAS